MSTTLEPHVVLEAVRPRRLAVQRRLASVRRQVRGRLLLFGAARTWGAIFLFAALSLAGDWLLRLSLPMRMALAAVALAAIAAVTYRHLVRPLLLRLDDLDLATVLDRRCPGFGQRVAAVLQLPALLEGKVLASPSMIHAAVLEHAAELERADLAGSFDRRAPRRWALLLALALALPAVFAAAWPEPTALWARRWFLGSNERWPQRTYLAVVGLGEGDRLLVPRGESVVVHVQAQPEFSGRPGQWRLTGRGQPLVVSTEQKPASEVPEQVGIRYQAGDDSARQGNFTHFGDDRFRYEVPAVVEPTHVSISGGDDWLGPILIEPIDRPAIESLAIVARAPGRSEPTTHSPQGADSQLLFLPRTQLELRLTSTVPLASAKMVAQSGPSPKLRRSGNGSYAAQWQMAESQTLEIRLVGREGGLGSKPYFLSIGLLNDRPPRITVRSSGVGRRITPQARVPLAVHALDDFGLTALAVEVEQTVPQGEESETTSHSVAIDLPPAGDESAPVLDFEVQPTIGLADYGPAAGNVIKLRGSGTDNCSEGSQPGTSRWLTFQVVTPEELFYEILMRQRAERAKFNAALEAAKSQTDALAADVTPEVAGGAVRRHQVIGRQVWQVANRLDATLQEMTLNELGSPQARELLKTTIIDALRQLHDEPMAALRTALEAVARDPAAEALTEARDAQQEVIQAMESILEQMSQWENFVDVLNQLREVIKLQDSVLESTTKQREKRTSDLFDD